MQEKIKSTWKSGNAYYYSVRNFLRSSMLSKSIKIKVYVTIILPVFVYESEMWSLTIEGMFAGV